MAEDIYRHFDTLSSFYEACNKEKQISRLRSSSDKEDVYNRGEGWFGTQDFPAAIKLATNGWKEGVKMAEPLARKLSEEMIETLSRPQVQYEVEGEMFDMGRVIQEEPECWFKWHPGQIDSSMDESNKGPVRIVLNNSVSCGISTDIIKMRGCAVMALAMVLSAADRPIQIVSTTPLKDDDYFSRDASKLIEFDVVLKDYYDDIQMDAVAFSLMHPSFFRRFGFRMMEILGIQSSGYGYPKDSIHTQKGDIYLGQAMWGDNKWKSMESAEKWVREQLVAQGVQFIQGA